jgi:hypothetical protein
VKLDRGCHAVGLGRGLLRDLKGIVVAESLGHASVTTTMTDTHHSALDRIREYEREGGNEMEEIEANICRYLAELDTADRQEPAAAKSRSVRLHEKIAAMI